MRSKFKSKHISGVEYPSCNTTTNGVSRVDLERESREKAEDILGAVPLSRTIEDERRLYQLNGVAHVAGTIKEELFGELPPPDKRKLYTVYFTWFHECFRVLPADASEETVRIYVRAYIMMLLSIQLFMDKSGNRVHLRWLPFVVRLDDIGSYTQGTAALAWLNRCMCRMANRNVTNLAEPPD
ncbi:hypothetical protein Ahy_A09g044953 [Arachis hypogaea]|uniref:Aminotransferase-like plant mobile domain-containing protein n=1 Tax=Arachis hypogaea TaxID=3818 RepID=A0A445BLB9_ARAHY|nr:hypothetical protein Ahy_A09g044953 [Arachis hypogaea]